MIFEVSLIYICNLWFRMSQLSQSVPVLNVLIIDDNSARVAAVQNALTGTAYNIQHLASTKASLLKEVEASNADIIILDMESPSRDTIESLSVISNYNPKPVVMFSTQDNPALLQESISAGVSSYIAGHIDPQRVKFILDVAVARFNEFQELKQELRDTKAKLLSRKWVDQAKALLIEKQGITEQEAYTAIRKMAMENGEKMEVVAKNLVSMAKLLAGGH